MRWVHDNGGPSLGYQSEVERNKKQEVRSDLLARWTRLLNITVPFARGQIPRYHDNPRACQGLAADIRELIVNSADTAVWAVMPATQRPREVLRLIASQSVNLPRVVVAHTLGVELRTLEAMMDCSHPIQQEHLTAMIGLTTLPAHFFKTGMLYDSLMELYRSPLQLAHAEGVTPEELVELIDFRSFLPALRWARRAGITPDELEAMLDSP